MRYRVGIAAAAVLFSAVGAAAGTPPRAQTLRTCVDRWNEANMRDWGGFTAAWVGMTRLERKRLLPVGMRFGPRRCVVTVRVGPPAELELRARPLRRVRVPPAARRRLRSAAARERANRQARGAAAALLARRHARAAAARVAAIPTPRGLRGAVDSVGEAPAGAQVRLDVHRRRVVRPGLRVRDGPRLLGRSAVSGEVSTRSTRASLRPAAGIAAGASLPARPGPAPRPSAAS